MARSMRCRGLATLGTTALLVGLGAAACSEAIENWPVHGEGAPGIDGSIDGEVLTFLADTGAPGATVAVTRHGRLVWSKGYGWANEAEQIRMQPWHRSRIGSVSKVITTIGVLQMIEPDASSPDSIAIGPSSLESKLRWKLYGHPGADFESAAWPEVTEPTLLDDPETYWEAIREGVQNFYPDTYETDMARMVDWASRIELGHLLSHTSGLQRGATTAGADYFGVDADDLTYLQQHIGTLLGLARGRENSDDIKCYKPELYVHEDDPDYTGQTYPLPPLLFEPGTKRCYSNQAFSLLGQIVDQRSGPGPDDTYRGVIEHTILQPLGLTDVVPNNVDISELDAWPDGSSLDPESPSVNGIASGGWSATGQDMVRILCGVDRESNHLRLLQPATVSTMESIAYPAADTNQPLGWDWRDDELMHKSGALRGGRAVIRKYLPGAFDAAPDDEINLAFNVNGGHTPPNSLLHSIASTVAEADIPEEYDLFDPAYACVVEPELGVTLPTIAPTAATTTLPAPGETLVAPTLPPTPALAPPGPTRSGTPPPTQTVTPPPTRAPAPPTVAIREPRPGQTVGIGAAQVYSALARDGNGAIIPGTRYRWTAVQSSTRAVLCTGSDLMPTPPTAAVDCTRVTAMLADPFRAGLVTIQVEARDHAGVVGIAEVTIALANPPVR